LRRSDWATNGADTRFNPPIWFKKPIAGWLAVVSLARWNSRRHFFSAAAEAMRRILIDHAREKLSQKRGGDWHRVDLPDGLIADERKAESLLALEEALARLEVEAPDKAQVVKLRFFGGLTIEEVAKALDISTTTADRHWAYARAWLKNEMSGPNS
jgi:RNA polymerase sigma factor (TIGR02999 family)